MSKDFFDNIQSKFLKFSSFENIVEELYLTSIVDSYSRVILIGGIESLIENQIRDKVYFDLENNNEIIKEFIQNKTVKLTNENRIINEVEVFRTDIEFFISTLGTFVIECKRLSSAEQRYVDEGVARFTALQYSKHESEAAMLSFIVGGNVAAISKGLKDRSSKHEPTTDIASFLNQLCLNQPHSFHSKHKRKSLDPILLHHLFFDFTKVSPN
jgi:hypothetical protein